MGITRKIYYDYKKSHIFKILFFSISSFPASCDYYFFNTNLDFFFFIVIALTNSKFVTNEIFLRWP